MIRGHHVAASPFAQTQCPFDGGEGGGCSRPYCPFLHQTGGMVLQQALATVGIETNTKRASAFTIAEMEAVKSADILMPDSLAQNVRADFSVLQEQPHGSAAGNSKQPALGLNEPMIWQENSAAPYAGGYMGYVAPGTSQQIPPQQQLPSAYNYGGTMQQQEHSFFAQNAYSSVGTSTTAQTQHNRHSSTAERRTKKKGEIPAYTPTPIAQLEQEKAAREKRKELAERQKRIQERLKAEKTAVNSKQPQNIPDPLDQIMEGQSELHSARGKEEKELEKRRQLQEHQKRVEQSKQRKGVVQSDSGTQKQQPRPTAASGSGSSSTEVTGSSPGWLSKKKLPPAPKAMDAKKSHSDAKRKHNSRHDEEVLGAVKLIKIASRKRNEEDSVAQQKKEEVKTKPKTVIDNLIEQQQRKKQQKENENGGTKSGQEDGLKKTKKSKDVDVGMEVTKEKEGVNDMLKNIAELDRNIDEMQRDIRKSKNKLAQLPAPITITGPSFSSLAHKKGDARKADEPAKKVPIWRQTHKEKRQLDESLMDRVQRKSSEAIIESLFGEKGSDDEGGGQKAKKLKKDKKQKERPIWDFEANTMKRSRNPSEKSEKKRHKKEEDEEPEEDEATRRERQALIDMLSDDQEEEDKPQKKKEKTYNYAEDEIQVLGVVCSSSSSGSNVKKPQEKPAIILVEEVEKKSLPSNSKSASTLENFCDPGVPTPLSSPYHQKQRHSPARSSASSSSVSVVPDTPSPSESPQRQVSPTKTAQNEANNSKKPNKLPSAQEQLHLRTLKAITEMTTAKPTTSSSTSTSSKPTAEKSTKPTESAKPKFTSSTGTLSATALAAQSLLVQKPQQPVTKTSSIPPSTLLKNGEKERKAHTPKLPAALTAKRQLIPLEPTNRKVPLQIRQSRLAMIFDEYTKLCPDDTDTAILSAQHEEKDVLDKCISKNGYCQAIPGVIRRLRDVAANKNAQQTAGGEQKKSVSHRDMLLGKHAQSVTIGLSKVQKLAQHKANNFSELDFYEALQKSYLLTEEQLWENGYPRWAAPTADEADDGNNNKDQKPRRRVVEIRQSELDATKGRAQKPFVPDTELKRICCRCGMEYHLTKDGNYGPGVSSDQCVYHWGRAWKKRVQGTVETRYTCCGDSLNVDGCAVAGRHITQTLRLRTLEQYRETPRPNGCGDPRSRKVYALDCEMVYSVWGPEVARISMVDITNALVLDLLIRPEHLLIDCNTRFSGLSADQILNAPNDLNKARERFFELVNAETILIGHSLESDLRAMRIVHKRVVDTSVVFPHRLGPPQKRALKTLASEILQLIIQEDVDGHDSKEDAEVCMRIMLKKVRSGEQ